MNSWGSAESPLIIAHRGASADLPENTLAAFALAAEQGADGIELDVQLSADKQIVIFHDSSLARFTGSRQKIANLTMDEIKRVGRGEGQNIPTLDELLEMMGPRLLYNVELKDFGLLDRGLETAVADRFESFALQDLLLVSSFNPFSVRRARRAFTRSVPVALIRAPGLLQFSYLLASGEVDNPHHSLVDQKYMAWAKARGYRVFPWTVDDVQEAVRLKDLGVHGIITNKPQALREQL
jgi:glycerophosphoryl diester phosphodiesterase